MFPTSILSLVLISSDPYRWKPADHLGKTPRQVVAIGPEKWFQLRSDKPGNLPYGGEIEEFSVALRLDNHVILMSLPKMRRNWILQAEGLAHAFAEDTAMLGSLLFSGTRWRTEGYSNHLDANLAVRRWFSQHPPKGLCSKSPRNILKSIGTEIVLLRADERRKPDPKEVALARRNLQGSFSRLAKHVQTGSEMDVQVAAIFIRSLPVFTE